MGQPMTLFDKQLLARWKPILSALDPMRELGADEIEALYAERQGAPYKALATDLAISDQPSTLKFILCGARGSGKSTELTRLANKVRNDFCVVHTDLAAGLPDEASTLAVVTLLGVASLHAMRAWSSEDGLATDPEPRGGAALQAALDKFGKVVPKVSKLLEGISGIVTLFDPTVGVAVKASGAAVASVGAEVRHALARGPLEGRLPPDKRDDAKAVVDAVNVILDELAKLAGRPVLLLADGLDKRTGVAEVQLALAEEYLLRELQAPLVLTGPVNLRHDPRFRAVPGNFRLALLYNVPVCVRAEDGTIDSADEGIAMLRTLYERRRAAAGFSRELIAVELIDRAAAMCSGIVRDFLGLLHAACKNALVAARTEVESEDLEDAIKVKRLEMEGYLDEGHLDILRRVLEKGVLPGTERADTLLFENFIACYPNGDIWFRPHELIVAFVDSHRVSE
jgi:hypothetical protein